MSVVVLILFLAAIVSAPISMLLALIFLAVAVMIPATDALVSLVRMKTPLEIQTPDGSNEPFHPSVVCFEEAWNGYRYWMAFTPYPVNKDPYRDRWECPCVVASNDGIHWEYPGASAFLDDLTEEQIRSCDYFSDTHLVFDEHRSALCCYYRITEGHEPKKVTIFRKETTDGINWSAKTSLTYPEEMTTLEPLSPSVVLHGGNFFMWYVAHSGDPNGIYIAESVDGLAWNNNQKCVLSGAEVTPWHIDVQFIDGCYYLTIYELTQRISLWTSANGVHFVFAKQLLTIPRFGNCGLFYNNILYRACMVKDTEGYKLYVSCGNRKKNTIGIMSGSSVSRLRIVSPSKKICGKMLVYDILSKYSYIERVAFNKIKMIVKR